jgi:Ca2+/H+ antiporter
VCIGFISELLVGSAEEMAQAPGVETTCFVGVILLADLRQRRRAFDSPILMARRNDMDTAMNINLSIEPANRPFCGARLRFWGGLMTWLHMGQAHHLDLVFCIAHWKLVAVILSVAIVVGFEHGRKHQLVRRGACFWPFM